MNALSPIVGMNPAELTNMARAEREHWWYRGMRSILHRVLSPHLADRRIREVLEAGCGTGFTAAWLHRRYGWNLFPVDLESTALRFVRNFALPNATQADIGGLPFQDASFDLVFCLDVLVHLPRQDETKALREFFRVLRRGGLLVLRVAAFDILRSRHSEFVGEKQRFTRGQRFCWGVQGRGMLQRSAQSNRTRITPFVSAL